MQVLSITGILLSDCEVRKDSRGISFLTFIVGTEESDINGKIYKDSYRCYCYNMSNPNVLRMKKGHTVALSGTFRVIRYKEKINFDIYVKQIAPMPTVNE